jgi:hypothetical protein
VTIRMPEATPTRAAMISAYRGALPATDIVEPEPEPELVSA